MVEFISDSTKPLDKQEVNFTRQGISHINFQSDLNYLGPKYKKPNDKAQLKKIKISVDSVKTKKSQKFPPAPLH